MKTEKVKYYRENFNEFVSAYKAQLSELESKISADSALGLFEQVKRDKLGKGPYAEVTFFEAANRILSDCVIINGVLKIFFEKNESIPFVDHVTIDFGHSNDQAHDIIGYDSDGKVILCVEAFNVSESFFRPKLYKTNVRLRQSEHKEALKVVLYNEDAAIGYRTKDSSIIHLKVKTLIS